MNETERLTQELISEQFGFAPSAFTRKAEDLANAVIYNVMEAVEKDMIAHLGDTDDVKKALVSLETLLENGVDKNFDRFEAFCFRNIFTLKEELLPYIRLEHHPEDGYEEALRGQDTALLTEWVRERDAVDEAVATAAAIRAAQARVDRRVAALEHLNAELDALTGDRDADAIRKSFASISAAAESMSSDTSSLLTDTPLAKKPVEINGPDSWQTREGYIRWAARRGATGQGRGLAKVEAEIAATGTEQDTKSLLDLLPAPAATH